MLVKCLVRRFLSIPAVSDGGPLFTSRGSVHSNFYGSRSFATSAVAYEVVKELEDLPAVQDILKEPDLLLDTGDLERVPTVDYTQRCTEFDGVADYDKAPEIVQKLLTLQYADRHAVRKRVETELVRRVQRYEDDFESPEVAIARQTASIRFQRQKLLTWNARFGVESKNRRYNRFIDCLFRQLGEGIALRNKLLTSLRYTHYEKFAWVLDQLKLSYHQQCPQQVLRDKAVYDKIRINEAKSVRRRKFEKYHQELKARQVDFTEKKERELKALDVEERELRKTLAELEAAKPVELQEEQLVDEIVAWKESQGFKTTRPKYTKSPPYIPPKDVKRR